MHEMGIALQIIDIVKASIPPEVQNPQVARINVSIGKLSAVVPASLRFCFDIAIKDTVLEGASLSIREIPVRLACNACGHKWTAEDPSFSCPKCADSGITMLSGRELDIDTIELDEDTDPD